MGDVIALDGGLFPEPPRQPGGDTSRGRGFGVEVKRRLKDRQAAAIARGQHPLSVALRTPLPLLPPPAGGGERARCGSCAHRGDYNPGHARSYPKCLIAPTVIEHVTANGRWKEIRYPRVTNGDGTDCRAWWPACLNYLAKSDPKETR